MLASQSEFLKLLSTLDATDRLTLRLASDSDPRRRVGLQCTYKDADRDRLILDARPPNAHELQLKRFVRHMANSSILLEIVLEDDEILSAYLDDIRDMYYVFEVSDERSCRNTFAREVFGSDARGLRAFPASASDSSRLVASLRTMAMGDTNACEIAQEAHLALAYEAGIIRPDSFLSPAALAPRDRYLLASSSTTASRSARKKPRWAWTVGGTLFVINLLWPLVKIVSDDSTRGMSNTA